MCTKIIPSVVNKCAFFEVPSQLLTQLPLQPGWPQQEAQALLKTQKNLPSYLLHNELIYPYDERGIGIYN